MNLLALLHAYPLVWSLAVMAFDTAKSISASSNTMKGSDPPNSNAAFFMFFPHTSATFFPPSVLPTNFTQHTLLS